MSRGWAQLGMRTWTAAVFPLLKPAPRGKRKLFTHCAVATVSILAEPRPYGGQKQFQSFSLSLSKVGKAAAVGEGAGGNVLLSMKRKGGEFFTYFRDLKKSLEVPVVCSNPKGMHPSDCASSESVNYKQ